MIYTTLPILSAAREYAASAVCLLIGAAGWYYLFYSRAAHRLEGIEQPTANRRRILYRRVNGVVMLTLATLLYLFTHLFFKERPLAFAAMLLSIVLLLMLSVLLAWVDMALTLQLRRRRKDDRDRHDGGHL